MMVFAGWAQPAELGLLIAALLAAAVGGIRLARIAHLPQVVGYLLLGLVLRLLLGWSLGGPAGIESLVGQPLEQVEVVKALALGLILFAIGAAFDAAHLRAFRGHIWKLTLAEVLTVATVVFAAVFAVGGEQRTARAVFLAVAAVATAPAATLLVLRQYGAKGPMTEHILAMTGMNNLVAIVLFYVAFLILAELGPGAGGIHAEYLAYGPVLGILLATLGSAALGFVIGLGLSFGHVVLTRFESLLLFFGIMLAISVGAEGLGLNHLIVCVFVGLAFTNFSIQPRRLISDLEPISAPIFALFFVLAGFNLELGRLREVGAIGVGFILLRAAGKVVGANLGVRWIGPRHRVSTNLGTAMLCQAGVSIGLGKYLVEHWGRQVNGTFEPDPGALAVNTVILASVAVFELTGPLATKRAVVRAGEVKAISLLARPGRSLGELFTIYTRLRRALSPALSKATGVPAEEPTVRHLMRTNIESLHDTATMAEVLRFVEHSRLEHFFVVDADGHFVGTINFRDLRNLVFNPILARMLTSYDMANTAPPVAMADQPLTDVLELFHRCDVGSLPVIENRESRRLLGVIEQRDVLRALHLSEADRVEQDEH